MDRLKRQFPTQNLSARSVQQLVQEYKQAAGESLEAVDLSRQRAECGGAGMKLNEELAKELIEINKHWGKLSCKKTHWESLNQRTQLQQRLCAVLVQETQSCSPQTLHSTRADCTAQARPAHVGTGGVQQRVRPI